VVGASLLNFYVGIDPVVTGDRLRPVTIEFIRRIRALHLTALVMTDLRVHAPRADVAGELPKQRDGRAAAE